ncbi:MAG: sugar phosphate isomerase/epimerase [Clostridiales bacterium]|nr:sugar phosphate isomerase/epimerase [Clostridiales bacterium]
MKIGISTASLFARRKTEDALEFLGKNNVQCAEVFLESYCEYNKEFGELLNSVKGNTGVHSVHTLTTQFEPQLYSINERAKADSFEFLKKTMQAGQAVGAKYYTFHGGARFKKTPFTINYDRVGQITQEIIDTIKPYGISLAYENVHWGYYNYIGFFNEIRKRTLGLKGTFDIKQARQSGIDYAEYIEEMGKDIVTAHLSDVDENGKMCLPGKGVTDFNDVLKRLKDVGFDGAILIEAYTSDYDKETELFESVEYLNNLSANIF